MTPRPLPPADLLRKLLIYDPATGSLLWRHRPADMFPDNGKGGRAANAQRWNSRCAGKPALNIIDTKGYLRGRLLADKARAHRVIWKMVYGEEPRGVIDHINGDPADNRIANLRVVDAIENSRNRKIGKNNTTGAVGVRPLAGGRWQAVIYRYRKAIVLGDFDSFEAAAGARAAGQAAYGFHRNHAARR